MALVRQHFLDLFMFSILGLGFLLGLQHAMEADHVAAVASLTAGRGRMGQIVRHGLFWGMGHALALSAFAGLVILVRGNVPAAVGSGLEFTVALMLIGLGAMVIWRVLRERWHFHTHRHADGKVHFHAHSHAGDPLPHSNDRHDHGHGRGGVRRSLAVGVMHGLAGSAALVALAVPGQWSLGLSFVLIFGIGSIAGMVMLTAVIALPIVISGRLATGLNRGLQICVGLISIGIGIFYALEQAPWVLTLL